MLDPAGLRNNVSSGVDIVVPEIEISAMFASVSTTKFVVLVTPLTVKA